MITSTCECPTDDGCSHSYINVMNWVVSIDSPAAAVLHDLDDKLTTSGSPPPPDFHMSSTLMLPSLCVLLVNQAVATTCQCLALQHVTNEYVLQPSVTSEKKQRYAQGRLYSVLDVLAFAFEFQVQHIDKLMGHHPDIEVCR